MSSQEVADAVGVSVATLYRYLAKQDATFPETRSPGLRRGRGTPPSLDRFGGQGEHIYETLIVPNLVIA